MHTAPALRNALLASRDLSTDFDGAGAAALARLVVWAAQWRAWQEYQAAVAAEWRAAKVLAAMAESRDPAERRFARAARAALLADAAFAALDARAADLDSVAALAELRRAA